MASRKLPYSNSVARKFGGAGGADMNGQASFKHRTFNLDDEGVGSDEENQGEGIMAEDYD